MPISKNDILAVGTTKKLKLVVAFENTATLLATDVALNLGAAMVYIQY